MPDHASGNGAPAPRTPETAAQEAMRKPLPRRFYKTVLVQQEAGQGVHAVLLDGKPLRTPARNPLSLPARAAAGLVAAEWQAQAERIDPAAMPFTRLVNTAIDGVASGTQAVFEDILRFAANDLVCYRATYPENLVEAQRAYWDRVLDLVEARTGARFEAVNGIQPVAQDATCLKLFSAALSGFDEPVALTCLHTMTTLTGSALIAWAHGSGLIDLDEAWRAAHVDEDHNIAQWGEDYEAGQRRAYRLAEMTAASRLLAALRQ